MRTEYNTTKLRMGRFSTIAENGCFKLQTAQGRFFEEGEVVLWDSYLRDFLKDDRGGVIIFQSKEETETYIKNADSILENERL